METGICEGDCPTVSTTGFGEKEKMGLAIMALNVRVAVLDPLALVAVMVTGVEPNVAGTGAALTAHVLALMA